MNGSTPGSRGNSSDPRPGRTPFPHMSALILRSSQKSPQNPDSQDAERPPQQEQGRGERTDTNPSPRPPSPPPRTTPRMYTDNYQQQYQRQPQDQQQDRRQFQRQTEAEFEFGPRNNDGQTHSFCRVQIIVNSNGANTASWTYNASDGEPTVHIGDGEWVEVRPFSARQDGFPLGAPFGGARRLNFGTGFPINLSFGF